MSEPALDAMALRRTGRILMLLGIVAQCVVSGVLVAMVPSSLRHGAAVLAVGLAVLVFGTALASRIWVAVIVWLRDRRLWETGQREPHAGASRPVRPAPLSMIVVGGLIAGALLSLALNAAGWVAAPLLWLVVGTIDLDLARRMDVDLKTS